MKNLILILALAASIPVSGATLADITRAISDGDAATLGKYFDQSVEVSILDKEDVYSQTQAVEIIKNFFTQNKPASFSQVHKGTSKGNDSQYCIGNLVASSGTYRVYIYVKVENGQSLIQELRFDKE